MTGRARLLPMAAALALACLAAGCGNDGSTGATEPATSTTGVASSTTVPEPATTTSLAAATTAAPTTTTATTTTAPDPSTTLALPPFPGDTAPKSGPGGIGLLTGVRFGDHEDFVRVVFDFREPSSPNWEVAYAAGEIEGMAQPEGGWVEGAVFLVARFAPAGTADIRQADPVVTYSGPRRIDVGLGSVVQLLLIEDFEANLWWAIGLTGEKPFRVGVNSNPPRIYVDISD